jgi:hypothetical protein
MARGEGIWSGKGKPRVLKHVRGVEYATIRDMHVNRSVNHAGKYAGELCRRLCRSIAQVNAGSSLSPNRCHVPLNPNHEHVGMM